MKAHVSPMIQERRERVLLILAGIFLSSLAILNVIGLTKFIEIGPLRLAVGVLPYPLTFLCTDLISELYGRRRANFVVWLGLFVNAFVLFMLWLGDILPAVSPEVRPPWQDISLAQSLALPDGSVLHEQVEFFHIIYKCTAGAVFASMAAYLTAQFVDVYLFHFWKKLTKGKHLWLRNNGSTLISQAVDSFMVIIITFGASYSRDEITFPTLLALIFSNYLFKFVAALLDTVPFYSLTKRLSAYLHIDPTQVE